MFHLAGSVLQHADALEACAFDLVERLAEQGLIYAEIRFAPALQSADCMALLREQFAFTDADFLRMDENALWGAFLPETEKAALVQRLRAGEGSDTVSG